MRGSVVGTSFVVFSVGLNLPALFAQTHGAVESA